MPVAKWNVFEESFFSSKTYANPFCDVTVTVTFTAPSGKNYPIEAFWDGGNTWRVRFSPDEIGTWSWQSSADPGDDTGLDNQRGTFTCEAYTGDNPLYIHGPLRVAENQCHLEHADGTPFFWLGDTAWNGVLHAKPEDWSSYLTTRREQSFNVIQFVGTHWRGGTKDLQGERAFTETEEPVLNADFYHRIDDKVRAINAHGLVAAPIMLWALTETDPGRTLTETAAIRIARYLMARWGAFNVVWMLGGDGHYYDEHAPRWQRIGRAVFGDRHDRPITLHPCGVSWVGEDFRGEDWFDFIGYQSGHGDSIEHLNWLVKGPPANQWNNPPQVPVINLEPNYEGHPAYQSGTNHSDHAVRRAAYWSLCVSPTAGVTYGNNPIWNWREVTGPAENHQNLTEITPWHTGVHMPGIANMTTLFQFFTALPWTTLRPAQHLLAHQPGETDPHDFITVAQTEDGSITLYYLPTGGTVALSNVAADQAQWFDPRSGDWQAAVIDQPTIYHAPDNNDWILVLQKDT